MGSFYHSLEGSIAALLPLLYIICVALSIRKYFNKIMSVFYKIWEGCWKINNIDLNHHRIFAINYYLLVIWRLIILHYKHKREPEILLDKLIAIIEVLIFKTFFNLLKIYVVRHLTNKLNFVSKVVLREPIQLYKIYKAEPECCYLTSWLKLNYKFQTDKDFYLYWAHQL